MTGISRLPSELKMTQLGSRWAASELAGKR